MTESVGKHFSIDKLLEARQKTKAVVRETALRVETGMTEEDGLNLIDKMLDKYGSENKWHPNRFRIGPNTTKSFREESEPGITLGENDLFFIDIGPVFENHEGDFGETFIHGRLLEYSKISEASKTIFKKTSEAWKMKALNGQDLYAFAKEKALKMGYELIPKMKGHRLSEFPHALHFKGGLSEIETHPTAQLWILEILIRHPTENFGAFYEDLLQ